MTMILSLVAAALLLQDNPAITVETTPDAVSLKSGGTEVLRYQLKKAPDSKLSVDSACYFHPFITPSGQVLTDVAPPDHKHHRGIFLAWFDMHGKKDADFWGWGMYAPVKERVIVNHEVQKPVPGALSLENHWQAEGETILK